jgi:hypothetical protein
VSRPRIGQQPKGGGGQPSNAELKASLQHLGVLPVEGVTIAKNMAHPMMSVIGESGEEIILQGIQSSEGLMLYLSVYDPADGSLADCAILNGPKLRALSAFLQEHFPNA